MFTGIIEELGTVTDWTPTADAAASPCKAPLAVSDAKHGDSISVSGVCLTVVDQGDDWFTADVMAESIAMSTLGDIHGRQPRQSRARREGGRPHRRPHRAGSHRRHRARSLSITDGSAWRVVRFDARPRARRARHPQGLDRDRRHLADGERGRRRLVRGLAHPRDARGHDARRATRRRPGQPRDRHPRPPGAATAVPRRRGRPHPPVRSAHPAPDHRILRNEHTATILSTTKGASHESRRNPRRPDGTQRRSTRHRRRQREPRERGRPHHRGAVRDARSGSRS